MTDIIEREEKLDTALKALGNAKSVSGRLRYICPCHTDSVPSLEMKADHATGNILLICRACGANGQQVCEALGMDVSVLMGGQRKMDRRETSARVKVYEEWKECPGVPEEFERETVHQYLDEYERLIFETVVYRDGSGQKEVRQRRPTFDENGEQSGYAWGLSGVSRHPLYNLQWLSKMNKPRLLEQDKPVFIVEGEKCADAMLEHKMLATTNAMGACKFDKVDEDSLFCLRNCDVIIIPDNDEIGYRHAAQAAEICCQHARSVRVWDWKEVDLPSKSGLSEWPAKYDIYDWLHGLKDAKTYWRSKKEAKAWILNHAHAMRLFQPEKPKLLGGIHKHKNEELGVQPASTFTFASIASRPVEWVWENRVPAGRLTIWGGMPGVGKSYVSMYVAACVSSGQQFVDGGACNQGDVLVMAAEDDPADTIAPRLQSFGADLNRIRGLDKQLYLDRDNATICRMIKHERLKLIVVDPVNAFIDNAEVVNYDAEVRKILTPLKDACEKSGCTIMFVTHFNKGNGVGTERFSGSGAWPAACRVAFVLGKHPDNLDDADSTAVFAPVKFNIADMPHALVYRIGEGGLQWLGEDDSVDAASVLENASLSRNIRQQRRLAIALIAGLLSRSDNHSAPSNFMLQACGQQGILTDTAHWAANYLGVIKAPITRGGKWYWTLPTHAEEGRQVDKKERAKQVVDSMQLEIKDILKNYEEEEAGAFL